MNFIETIIGTALLGTAQRELDLNVFPAPLQDIFMKAAGRESDGEGAFYKMAALAFAYQRAGFEIAPANDKQVAISGLPEEAVEYFGAEVDRLLYRLIDSRNLYLLRYAYQTASHCGKLLSPRYLRQHIEIAFDRNNPERSEMQKQLALLTGKRGRWLLSLMGMPDWGEPGNEPWETASHDERKRILTVLRKTDPSAGLALLQSELKNETAAHRDELLQCLQINVSKSDEAFLQEIFETDRSSIVKTTARRLLLCIPDSELVMKCRRLLNGRIRYRRLFGWSYDTVEYTHEMKALGIEEVSPNKNENDSEYILRQLAERMPLDFWAETLDCQLDVAARRIASTPPFKQWFDVSLPIARFDDRAWAFETLKENGGKTSEDLIQFLSPEQREQVQLKFKGNYFDMPDSWFNADGSQWGMKFASLVFRRLLKNKYYYNVKSTTERLALYFPDQLVPEIEQAIKLAADDVPTRNFCESLLWAIETKREIDSIFR